MKLDELAKEYGLLIDEGGRYYRINERGEKEEPFAPIRVITGILGISSGAIADRIGRNCINAVFIKNNGGLACDGYNLNQVKLACADLLVSIYMTDLTGVVRIDGKDYAALSRIAILLNTSDYYIGGIAISLGLQPKKLRILKSGKIVDGYCIETIRQNIPANLNSLPSDTDNGCALINGRRYLTLKKMAKLFGLCKEAIAKRIQVAGLKPIQYRQFNGKNKLSKNGGKIVAGYDVELVQRLCSDSLQVIKADDQGEAIWNGQKIATAKRIANLLCTSTETVLRRLNEQKIPTFKLKLKRCGLIVDGYYFEQALAVCSDLAEKLPQADQNGICTINGNRVATLHRLSQILGYGEKALKTVIQKAELQPISFRLGNGNRAMGYYIKDIEKSCKDFSVYQSR